MHNRDVTLSVVRPLALANQMLLNSGADLRKKHRIVIRLADTVGRNWTALDADVSIKTIETKRGSNPVFRICAPTGFRPMAWTVALVNSKTGELIVRSVPVQKPVRA